MGKSFYIALCCLVVFFVACRNEVDKASEDEEVRIKKYLKNNGLDTISPTQDGLYYIPQVTGTGDTVKVGDFISANINGAVLGKALVASDIDSNMAFVVGNGRLIRGIELGVQMMREGEKTQFIVPFKLAYYSPLSPENNFNTYLFEVEINEIIDTPLVWEIERIEEFLAKNEYDIEPDTLGFCYVELKEGDGDTIQVSDYISIHFESTLLDGTVLSYNDIYNQYRFKLHPETYIFNSDTVLNAGLIKGFTQMRENGEGLIIIPSSMAYGGASPGIAIPAYSTIIFHIKGVVIID